MGQIWELISIHAEELRAAADLIGRIAVACFFGGLIGMEREATNRPAGFRTHVLVCVGSALTMMTGEYAAGIFPNAEPLRIGAQVVSGVGFLGAGTIMRAGLNVRGLTTAASLWAVSCVGLAAGIGHYSGAIAVGTAIYVVLTYFKRFERAIWEQNTFRTVTVRSDDIAHTLPEINTLFDGLGVVIKNIEFDRDSVVGADSVHSLIRITIHMPNCSIPNLLDMMRGIRSVDSVVIE